MLHTSKGTHTCFAATLRIAHCGTARRCRHPACGSSVKRRVTTSSLQSASSIVDDIVDLTAFTNRGVDASPANRDKILKAVDALANMQKGVTRGSDLDGTYKLLFSTEKETQFIVANASKFGSTAGDIYQVINTRTGRLQNVITFPPDGSFIVNSSIELVPDSQRVNFKFDAASFTVNKRKFAVPPFGSGWFDSVYVDDRVRIARDIRSDILVARRDGPPRMFS